VAVPPRSVPEAADDWARTVFGAPRHLSTLVDRVDVRDEEIERLYTEVIRRDIREERQFTTARRTTSPRVDPSTVDPFTISVEALRTASEYVATCLGCGGSGTAACGGCRGAGRVDCPTCRGRGEILRQYKKSSRWIKCTECRGKQTQQCDGCRGKGTVNCQGCEGGGCQSAWLTYGQTATPYVAVLPRSPILSAHRQLAEPRPLRKEEVAMFALAMTAEAAGPLVEVPATTRTFARSNQPRLDPRLERISHQQYFKLAVLRRDATYTMCGAQGQLVFSGHKMTVAPTPLAVAPIQRRLWLWGGASVGIAGGLGMLMGSFLGKAAYFEGPNRMLALLWLGASLFGALSVGALLREAGPRFRWARLAPLERAFGAVGLAGAALIAIVGLATRPRLGQVQTALASGDANRARLVVEALEETQGQSKDVLEAKDEALMAAVPSATGDERLHLLDQVASHGGERAKGATDSARKERLDRVRQLLDAKKPAEALAKFEQWFSAWKDEPELREMRGLIHDAVYATCQDDPCKLQAAQQAVQANPSTARASRLDDAQRRLVDVLSFSEVLGESTVSRLQRLKAMASVAAKVTSIAGEDAKLADKAKGATERSSAERAKVPVLGNEEGVAAELLGPLTAKASGIASVILDGTEAYLALDGQRRCRGLYAVGPKGNRALRSTLWSGDRLLSQTVGHPTTVKKASTSTGVVRWQEGAIPVVARWKDGELMELRVGAATP